MFRCKECQTEYKVKPDYCDCGNDTFDEIVEHAQSKKPEPKPQNVKPQPVLTPEEKPQRKERKKSQITLFGWIIFAFCVILSFVIVFFVGNPKDEPIQETKEEVKVDTSYIPKSTNAFWDNTVKTPEPEPIKEEVKKVIEQIIPKPAQTKPVQTVQKPAQTTQKPTPKTTTQTKQQTTSTPAKTTTTPKQTNVQLPKSVTDIANQHKTTQTQQTQKSQTTQAQTTKPAQTTVQQQPKAEPKKMNQQEYANYKINLRNTIAQKINFAGVVGDGDCIVSFSISNNGTLINRKFEKQSANNTLNDAVYHAIMQTPGFKNPPEGYDGRTMKFTVKMYNGNFEVTLN